MSVWMNEWVCEWMSEQMNECMNEWVNKWKCVSKWMNEWVNKWMSTWINALWMNEWVCGWMNEYVNEWRHGWILLSLTESRVSLQPPQDWVLVEASGRTIAGSAKLLEQPPVSICHLCSNRVLVPPTSWAFLDGLLIGATTWLPVQVTPVQEQPHTQTPRQGPTCCPHTLPFAPWAPDLNSHSHTIKQTHPVSHEHAPANKTSCPNM